MNPEFVNPPVRASKAIDLSTIPPSKVTEATNKLAVLSMYRAKLASGEAASVFVPRVLSLAQKAYPSLRLSARTLRRWHQECPSSGRTYEAVIYFLDKRGGQRTSRAARRTGARDIANDDAVNAVSGHFETGHLRRTASSLAK